METLYSITFPNPDRTWTVVDYVDGTGWFRHDFDAEGTYVSAGPADLSALRPLDREPDASLVYELRKVADALGEALTRADARVYGRLRADRHAVLERLERACDRCWGPAVQRLARIPDDDDSALARATRAVEFIRSSRELARDELAEEEWGRPAL